MNENTYGGTTTVDAGVLLLEKGRGAIAIPGSLVIGTAGAPALVKDMQASQFNGNGDVIFDPGGLLELNGFNDTIDNLILKGGTATTGSGVLTVDADVNYWGGAPSPTLLAANLNLAGQNPPSTFTAASLWLSRASSRAATATGSPAAARSSSGARPSRTRTRTRPTSTWAP